MWLYFNLCKYIYIYGHIPFSGVERLVECELSVESVSSESLSSDSEAFNVAGLEVDLVDSGEVNAA